MNINEYLDKIVNVIIDKPIGSFNPIYKFIYPVNCGFVSDKINNDKKYECYVLGLFDRVDEYEGKCIAIIKEIDGDDKLVIVPKDKNYSNETIEALVEFQERFFEHEIIRSDVVFNSLIPELSVSNIDVSKKFYENLGFKVVYKRPENKFYFMELENNQIMLEENNGNWNVGKLEYPYGNGINISMSINDVEKKYEELKNKNIKFFLDLEVHEYKVNNKIYKDSEFLIQDPDGYLIRFNN